MPHPVVVIDLAAGRARVGGITVAVRARPGGALAVSDLVIRPLGFGERWRLLNDGAPADGAGGGVGRIGAAFLACATAATGEPTTREPADDARPDHDPVRDAVHQVLALHLAGARPDRPGPGFARQLASLISAGWTPADVLGADADLVDVLTAGPEANPATESASGWTSIVLVADEPTVPSVFEVRQLLESDLVGRLVASERDESRAAEPPSPDALIIARSHRTDRAPFSCVDQRTGGRPAGASTDPAPAGPAPTDLVPADLVPADPAPADLTRTVAGPTDPTPIVAAPLDQASIDHAPIDPTIANPGPTMGRTPKQASSAFPSPIRPMATIADLRTPAAGIESRPAGLLPFPAAIDHPVRRGAESGAGRPALTVATTAPTVVRPDPVSGRVGSLAAPQPAGPDAFEIADRVAALLDEESDLRGLRR